MNSFDELSRKQHALNKLFRVAAVLLIVLASFAVGWLIAMISFR